MIWNLPFWYLVSAAYRLHMPCPWSSRDISLLVRLTISGISSSVHRSNTHTPGTPWCTYYVAESFILWPPQNPIWGNYSAPSSVIIVSLEIATLYFGIVIHRWRLVYSYSSTWRTTISVMSSSVQLKWLFISPVSWGARTDHSQGAGLLQVPWFGLLMYLCVRHKL